MKVLLRDLGLEHRYIHNAEQDRCGGLESGT
jgi:hypothetical protein